MAAGDPTSTTPTTTVNTIIDPTVQASISNTNDLLAGTNTFINSINEGLGNVNINGKKLTLSTILKDAHDAAKLFSGAMDKAGNIISNNDTYAKAFTNTFLTLKASLTRNENLFAGIGKSGSDVFGNLSSDITAITATYGELEKVVGSSKAGKLFLSAVANLSTAASSGQEAESSFIRLMSTSGRMGEIFDKNGQIIGDLEAHTLKYSEMLLNTADATGFTGAEVAKYSDQLGKIPGFLDQNVKGSTNWTAGTDGLTASLKLLSGSGQDISKLVEVQGAAYDNLGNAMGRVDNSAQKTAELFATISTVSKALGVNFDPIEKMLTGIAQSFKFVGDQTDGATKIIGRFTNALRDTGLTTSASLDIVKEMTENLGKLTMGTKAFISAQSGGPGGLQGAFQIEKLMRENKSDQVMGMIESTLKKQFGGNIANSDQAAASPEAASQFNKQRAMLESGAFGGLIGSGPEGDAKATKLLDALSKGNLGGASNALKSGKDAVDQVMTQGNELQKANNTVLNKIANSASRQAIAAELNAWASLKLLAGSSSSAKKDIEKFMDDARSNNATMDTDPEGNNPRKFGNKTGSFDNTKKQVVGESFSALDGIISQLEKGGKDVADKTIKDAQTIGLALKDIHIKLAEDAAEKDITKNTPQVENPATASKLDYKTMTRGHSPALNTHTQPARNAASATQDQKTAQGPQRVSLEITIPPGTKATVTKKDKEVDVFTKTTSSAIVPKI
jgi:hypothetical protein